MNHDMCAVLGRGHYHWSERIINHQLYPMLIGDFRKSWNVTDLKQRIRHCFSIDDLRIRADGLSHLPKIRDINKSNINIEFPDVIVEEGKGSPIDCHGTNDVIPAFNQLQDRACYRRHS